MNQVITVELDNKLVQDVDIAIEKSSFRNRTHLVEYLLQRFAYEKKLVKHRDIIFFLTILLCFAIMFILLIMR